MAGGKGLTKVVYKPDSQSTDEYIAIVNPEQFKKWKDGDTSIALALVVDSFDVFHSGQGSQGLLGRPSKQQLDTVFGTHNDDEVMKIVLEKGQAQASDGIWEGHLQRNVGRSGNATDTRGSNRTSGI